MGNGYKRGIGFHRSWATFRILRILTGWWFGTSILFSHKNWECHHPNWLSYFSEGWPWPANQIWWVALRMAVPRSDPMGLEIFFFECKPGVRKLISIRIQMIQGSRVSHSHPLLAIFFTYETKNHWGNYYPKWFGGSPDHPTSTCSFLWRKPSGFWGILMSRNIVTHPNTKITWLVVWNIFYFPTKIGNVIIPID